MGAWRRSFSLMPVVVLVGCGSSVLTPSPRGDLHGTPDLTFSFDDVDLELEGPEDLARYHDRDASCAQVSAEATLVKKPVDIIFVIDNSGSMTDEIRGVEKNINQNFTQIMNQSGVDYRVVMVTSHGSSAQQKICVDMPLSGHTCNPPPAVPVNNKRYFHYDYNIQSTDSFRKLIMTYNLADSHGLAPNGWAGYLRKDSVKMFLEITDDQSAMDEVTFEQMLLALKPALFGTMQKRNYIFHSIIGLTANNPAIKPWGPKDPFQNGKCGIGAVNNGPQYQRLSMTTGGMRFPICEWANFDGVFKEIAKGVIEGTKVECNIQMPMAPMGQDIDPSTLVVEYTPSNGGPVEELMQVYAQADCTPDSFYVEVNGGQKRIVLCADACKRVQIDPKAKLRVVFDCQAPLM